jgi:hypothetical protein
MGALAEASHLLKLAWIPAFAGMTDWVGQLWRFKMKRTSLAAWRAWPPARP